MLFATWSAVFNKVYAGHGIDQCDFSSTRFRAPARTFPLFSSNGFTRSLSPIDTPPDCMNASVRICTSVLSTPCCMLSGHFKKQCLQHMYRASNAHDVKWTEAHARNKALRKLRVHMDKISSIKASSFKIDAQKHIFLDVRVHICHANTYACIPTPDGGNASCGTLQHATILMSMLLLMLGVP
jgi:hypothetical protein